MRSPGAPRTALVLSGGAARGAYEAGVVAYLLEGLVRDTGVRARFDVICGSSVGAPHSRAAIRFAITSFPRR